MVVDSSGVAQIGAKTHHAKIAVLLSLIPGLGQIYNRQVVKGAIFFALMACFFGVFHDFLQMGFWGLFTLGTELPRKPICKKS